MYNKEYEENVVGVGIVGGGVGDGGTSEGRDDEFGVV